MDKVFKLRDTQKVRIQNMKEMSKIFDAISNFNKSDVKEDGGESGPSPSSNSK